MYVSINQHSKQKQGCNDCLYVFHVLSFVFLSVVLMCVLNTIVTAVVSTICKIVFAFAKVSPKKLCLISAQFGMFSCPELLVMGHVSENRSRKL